MYSQLKPNLLLMRFESIFPPFAPLRQRTDVFIVVLRFQVEELVHEIMR